MNKFTTSLVLFFVAFVTVNSETALAQTAECKIFNSTGDRKVFPEWTSAKKTVVIPWGQAAAVWLSKACDNGKGVYNYVAASDITFEEEGTTLGRTLVMKAKHGGIGLKKIDVRIETPVGKNFSLTIVLASSYEVAMTLISMVGTTHSRVVALSSDVENIRKDVASANDNSVTALKTARKAKARTELGVDIQLAGVYNFETPGSPGGGFMIQINKFWGFKGDKILLGFGLRLSYNRYELQLVGNDLVNKDVFGQETDISALFHFMWRPNTYFGLFAETGFGLRFFQHDDTVSSQDGELYIKGVEGNFAKHATWVATVGFKFFATPNFYISAALNAAVALNPQVNHPSGDDDVEATLFNGWDLGLNFGLGVSF